MPAPKPIYLVTHRNYRNTDTASYPYSNTRWANKEHAKLDFIRLAAIHVADPDVYVSMGLITSDDGAGSIGMTVYASKSRNATHVELNQGWFGINPKQYIDAVEGALQRRLGDAEQRKLARMLVADVSVEDAVAEFGGAP